MKKNISSPTKQPHVTAKRKSSDHSHVISVSVKTTTTSTPSPTTTTTTTPLLPATKARRYYTSSITTVIIMSTNGGCEGPTASRVASATMTTSFNPGQPGLGRGFYRGINSHNSDRELCGRTEQRVWVRASTHPLSQVMN